MSRATLTIDPTRDDPDPARRSASVFNRQMTAERLTHGRRTMNRNRRDIERADLVLACFLGAEAIHRSVGELFWADALRKPIVIVREEKNLQQHDMLNDLTG